MGGLSPTIHPPSIYKQGNAPDQQSGAISPIPWTDDLWVDTVNHLTKRCTAMNPYVWVSIEGGGGGGASTADHFVTWQNDAELTNQLPLGAYTKGANVLNPQAINAIVYQAPFTFTVTAVKGYFSGGTSATVNARKNGSLTHLASDLSLVTADTWTSGGAVQNAAYAVNDKLEIMITSVNGPLTQCAVVVEFTRP